MQRSRTKHGAIGLIPITPAIPRSISGHLEFTLQPGGHPTRCDTRYWVLGKKLPRRIPTRLSNHFQFAPAGR